MSSFKSRSYKKIDKKLSKKLKGYKINEKYTQKDAKMIEVPIDMKAIEGMTKQDIENHLKFLVDNDFIAKE